MIYLIYGQDNFRSEQYLHSIIDFYQKNNPFYFSFDFADNSVSCPEIAEIKEIINGRNLFADTKLLIFKNLLNSASDVFQKEVVQIINLAKIDKSKSIMLVIYENDDIKKKTALKWLKDRAKAIKEYPLLKKSGLSQWLEQASRQFGFKLKKDAADLLISSFGSDTGLIYYALKKLSLLEERLIDKKALEEYIFLPLSSNIFGFLDCLAGRNINSAFALLIKEIHQNEPLMILKMITFEFRNLILIKGLKTQSLKDIQKKTNIHPYTLSKIYPLTRNFSFEELKKIYQKLYLCDEQIKKGMMSGELALEMLLLNFKQILAN